MHFWSRVQGIDFLVLSRFLILNSFICCCCDFVSDKTIRIWKWIAGTGFTEDKTLSPLIGHKYAVTCVRISPQVNFKKKLYKNILFRFKN